MNSGSEANDLALRIASAATAAAADAAQGGTVSPLDHSRNISRSRDHVVVMAGAYHGHLSSLIPLRCVCVEGGCKSAQLGGSVATTNSLNRCHKHMSVGSLCHTLCCCCWLLAAGCCSPYKFWGPGGSGKPDWVHVMPAPDMYRCVPPKYGRPCSTNPAT